MSFPPPGSHPPPPPPLRPLPPGAVPPEGYVPVGWTGVPRPPRVDGMAIAALLCGPGAILCFLAPVLGIIFGFVSRSRIRKSGGDLTGAGLAVAAIIVSSLMVAAGVLFFLVSRVAAGR